jgi:hypothetical protein
MSTEITLQVNTGPADAYQRESYGTIWTTGTTVDLYSATGPLNRYWTGFRFTGDNLPPKGRVIEEAYLQVYMPDASRDDVNGNLHFEKQESPELFSAILYNITNRTRTALSASWVGDGLGTGWHNSPSLVQALQEVIDAYDVTALVIIARPNTNAAKTARLQAFEGNPTLAAKLFIKYAPPPVVAPTVQTGPADEITATTAKLHGILTDDGGEPCSVRFAYGIKPDYTATTEWQDGKITNDQFEAALLELDPETTYVFKAVALNSEGQAEGDELEFTTAAAPPPIPPPLKLLITHPAIKDVKVYKDGELEESYENLSNLDEQRIEDTVEIPIVPPATLEVITLGGLAHIFEISE